MKLQTGRIVKGEEFTGREELLERVYAYIEMNQSIVLVAPRRYGKSSIIRKVLDNTTNHKSIEIDLMKIYNKRDLAEKIIEETYKLVGISNVWEYAKKTSIQSLNILNNILKKINITFDEVEIGITFDLASKKDDDAFLLHALELPEKIAKSLNIRIIFAIDELGEIRNLKEYKKILDVMRSVFQTFERTNFIFAGSQYSLMNEIFTDRNSPFFRFAEILNVPTMKVEEFEGFFEKVFKIKEISLYKGFTHDLVEISGGIPYYIIKIAQEVFISAVVNKKMNTYPVNVCKAALARYEKEETYFLGELSRVKGKKYYYQLLKALSVQDDPYKALESKGVLKQNVNKILLELMNDGIIEKNTNSYSIIDPFLSRFIRKM